MIIRSLIRFAVVGVAQNAVNLGTFTVELWLGVPYRPAAAAAALVALVLSFASNRWWTFYGAAGGSVGRDAIRYTVVFASAVAVGVALLTCLVDVVGLHPIAAQAVAILAVAPLSFLAQRLWVFRVSPPPGGYRGALRRNATRS
jgi:putative flippase GtrA